MAYSWDSPLRQVASGGWGADSFNWETLVVWFLVPDKLTSSQRHHGMSRIRGKNTKPEILVRKGLHACGFRFCLHNKKLPGSPDAVLPKYVVAIMVNGCFWHGHKGWRYATKPKSNIEFWETKIARNRHRDEVTTAHLESLGWTVITVWECELRKAILLTFITSYGLTTNEYSDIVQKSLTLEDLFV